MSECGLRLGLGIRLGKKRIKVVLNVLLCLKSVNRFKRQVNSSDEYLATYRLVDEQTYLHGPMYQNSDYRD